MTKHVEDPIAAPTTVVIVVFALLVAITVIALQAYFGRVEEEEFESKIVSRPDLEKTLVFTEQREKLSQYGWVDRETGTVRIPVERAMDLVVNDLQVEEGSR